MSFDAGSIEAKLDLDRTPFTEGLDRAEKDAREFGKKKFTATVNVNVDKAKAEAELKELGKNTKAKVKVEVQPDKAQANKAIDDIAKNTKKTADRSGGLIGRMLTNPILIQLATLPAAAAIASAGVGAALAVPVIGLAAWGIAAQKSNQQVKGAFTDLKNQVVLDSKDMSQALTPALIGVAAEAKTAWIGLKPQFTSMFQQAAPLVHEFADGVTGLAVNSIPGIQLAVQRGEPAIRGWSSLLASTGTGLSDLFDNASRHATSAGTGLTELGNTIKMLLGFVGTLIGVFSDAWAQIGGPFNAVLSQVLGIVTQFTKSALPGLSGGFKGIMLLIQGILNVLGPFANLFGTATGSILGAVAAYKLLSKAVEGIGGGLTKAKTWVSEVSTKFQESAVGVQMFGDKTKKTGEDIEGAGEKSGKFATAASKVGGALKAVGNSLPFIGAAFVAVSSIIDELSKTSQDRADEVDADMQKQRDALDKQTNIVRQKATETADALNFYNRAVQQNGSQSDEAAGAQEKLAKSTLSEKDAQKQAADATKTHTERLLDFFDALTGGLNKQVAYNTAVKDLKDKEDALATAIKEHGKGSTEAKFATDDLALAMANQVKAAGDLAAANASGKSEYDKLVDVQKATGTEALKLIELFGTQAPDALYATVGAMSETELKAIGVTKETNNAGDAVLHLPDGKTITINHNMVAAAQDAVNLKNRVDEIPTGNKFFNYFINTVTSGPDPNKLLPMPMGHAGGTEFFRAPFNLTKINEVGPEIAQLPTGSKIFTTGRSAIMVRDEVQKVLKAMGGDGASVQNYVTINPPPMSDPEWLARVSREVSRDLQQRMRQGR